VLSLLDVYSVVLEVVASVVDASALVLTVELASVVYSVLAEVLVSSDDYEVAVLDSAEVVEALTVLDSTEEVVDATVLLLYSDDDSVVASVDAELSLVEAVDSLALDDTSAVEEDASALVVDDATLDSELAVAEEETSEDVVD